MENMTEPTKCTASQVKIDPQQIHTVKGQDVESKEKTEGPVAKPLHSQCRKPGFDPWSGN